MYVCIYVCKYVCMYVLYPHPQWPYPKGTPGSGSTLIDLFPQQQRTEHWLFANIIQAWQASVASKAIKYINNIDNVHSSVCSTQWND